jgi:L-iditol 2-dehydrogenase
MSDSGARMRAAVLLGPERLEIRDVAVPEPGPGELLLRIGAATTCGTDVKVYLRGGHPRMLEVPALFGHEMAGTVEQVGDGVNGIAPGDRVVVGNSAACGGCDRCRAGRENLCPRLAYLNGAFAEFIRVPAAFVRRSLYPLPVDMAFERAALAEPLACVLHGLDACELAAGGGAEVVVFGAGPIGLLFVAALARSGQRVLLADPNPRRLEVGTRLGAAGTLHVERGGGQAAAVRTMTRDAEGADVAVDCTGVPEVWSDAMECVRPGGLVNLFGGCAPGTRVPLDTHRVHYSEITVKGVYHHRPQTFRRAVALLHDPTFPASELLSARRPVAEVEQALRSMMRKETLKVVIAPS